MLTKIKISIQAPDKADHYFSFKLIDLNNERSEFFQPTKMLVVSDIEGNFQTFCRHLVKARIIDKYLEWTFGNGHLVIVGDCFDRGEQVIECLWLIYSLEYKARKQGGHVHFILGNHEIMNLNSDWRYVHPRYAVKKAASKNPAAALYDGNTELWRWLQTKNIMEKIGDVLFVHGGVSEKLLQLNLSISEINNIARPYYKQANKLFTDPALHTIFNSTDSPFWYRGYYQQATKEELIDATLNHFGVKTIVTGHTIMDKITAFYKGKVINVDTDHASGNSETLLIRKDRFYKIDKEGKRERIK
jgi:hypothetical protein